MSFPDDKITHFLENELKSYQWLTRLGPHGGLLGIRDVMGSESESDGIRHFFQNPKSDG